MHVQPEKAAFTLDKEEIHVGLPAMENFQLGSWISVQVSCLIGSNRFYAILPHGVENLKNCVSAKEKGETLESLQVKHIPAKPYRVGDSIISPVLQEALQKEYATNYYSHTTSTVPSIGQIIIARNPKDDRWYRGRVVADGESDHYAVFFLDFGDTHLVHQRSIRKPLGRFLVLPAQAVEMHLNGIDASDRKDEISFLAKLVKERDLVAKIVQELPYVSVDLYYTTRKREINIAKEMTKRFPALSAVDQKHLPQYTSGNNIPG